MDTPTSETLAGLLVTLVDIPSVTGDEGRMADFVLGRLRARGGGEILRSGHAVVWRGPRRGRPLALLAGHLDTVPPAGNARARLEGGSVHGVGATDMKGGLAVMLGVLEAADPGRLRFDLAAVFYDAEEGPHAGNGLGRLLGEMPWLREAALAVLLEPTAGAVELGCNGVLNAEVRVTGRRAHAARPWMGVNAVERAAPWLAAVVATPAAPVTVDGVEFVETLQVTTLRAGGARNVVPDELVANLNHRFPPDRTLAEAERRLRARVPEGFGFTVVDAAPAGKVCASDPEVAGFVRRFGLRTAGKQGWTDVARFTAAGIPAFNFGPGLPELCHAPDERCPIEHLGPACRMLAEHLSEEP